MREKIILEMTPDTAAVVQAACEFYTRAMWGQYRHVIDTVADGIPYSRIPLRKAEGYKDAFDMWLDARERAENYARLAKAALFPELPQGATYGVRHFKPADIATHVWQTIRHRRAWHDHPQGGITVDFDKPMQWTDEPLPKCRIVEDENDL